MTHAYDKTLIQQLGADLDHKTPAHDAACFYLQQRAAILAEKFRPTSIRETGTGKVDIEDLRQNGYITETQLNNLQLCPRCSVRIGSNDRGSFKFVEEEIALGTSKTHLEVPITKGEHQYRVHIGFVDLVIETTRQFERTIENEVFTLSRLCYSDPKHNQENVYELLFKPKPRIIDWSGYTLAIEVKTQKCPTGDLIRQVKLYRGYMPQECVWVVATTYLMNELEVAALENEHIKVIRINEDYAAYSPKPGNVEVF